MKPFTIDLVGGLFVFMNRYKEVISIGIRSLCECGMPIPYGTRFCEGCKSSRGLYIKTCRTSKNHSIYTNSKWIRLREQCIRDFNGMCLYNLYTHNKVVEGYIVHHIIEVEEDMTRAYDISNLIFVTDEVHRYIHKIYNRSLRSKRELQHKLFEYRDRYRHEYV